MQWVENVRRFWRRFVGGAEEPAPETVEQMAPVEPEGEDADDLTAIRGIGAATQKRLHAAGITTYAQLVGANPDDVSRALDNEVPGSEVEKWIGQARDLAPKE